MLHRSHNKERVVEIIPDTQVDFFTDILDRLDQLETRVADIKQNQSAMLTLLDAVITGNRLQAEQEERRREIQEN